MPECATCEEYISPDFVRVFGDNNRVVTACLSCRGSAPGPETSETEEPSVVETVEHDTAEASSVSEDTYEVETADAGSYQDSAVETDYDVGTVEPETATTASSPSPMAFLRSVFLR